MDPGDDKIYLDCDVHSGGSGGLFNDSEPDIVSSKVILAIVKKSCVSDINLGQYKIYMEEQS